MAKVRVLVKGNVQGVGFRALLVQTARRYNLKGIARNLRDGTVEIFCDGSEKNIEAFLTKMNAKGDPEDPFSLHVTHMKSCWEGKPGYKEAWRSYEGFEIDYGAELDPFQKLTVEDMEYGKYYLSETRSEIKDTRSETKEVRSEIKLMRSDMKQSFGQMAMRYDRISRQVEGLQEVPQELKLLRKAVEKFLNALAQEK